MIINFSSINNQNLDIKIENKLHNFNISKREWFRNSSNAEKKQCFYAFDGENLIGGAVGFVKYDWYYLDLLYVEESYRKHGIGSQLIKKIEDFANKSKLTGIRLETWDFQAKGFYEKNGYVVFGKIENCPPGITEYHLKKELKN